MNYLSKLFRNKLLYRVKSELLNFTYNGHKIDDPTEVIWFCTNREKPVFSYKNTIDGYKTLRNRLHDEANNEYRNKIQEYEDAQMRWTQPLWRQQRENYEEWQKQKVEVLNTYKYFIKESKNNLKSYKNSTKNLTDKKIGEMNFSFNLAMQEVDEYFSEIESIQLKKFLDDNFLGNHLIQSFELPIKCIREPLNDKYHFIKRRLEEYYTDENFHKFLKENKNNPRFNHPDEYDKKLKLEHEFKKKIPRNLYLEINQNKNYNLNFQTNGFFIGLSLLKKKNKTK